ncbi:hypothetical protein [Microvirga lenta]|uniref:hypothetical protein n=1 Tax=Microvirga lenta TaxID=2881337 RepID=UPI001CFF639E|nr:hypothetical protein [Microvirga lenta]MCB5175541.1 hypothetical protein [Microvirga lenta]
MSNQTLKSQLKALKAKAGVGKNQRQMEPIFCLDGLWYRQEVLSRLIEAEERGEDPATVDLGRALTEEEVRQIRDAWGSLNLGVSFVRPEYRRDANTP